MKQNGTLHNITDGETETNSAYKPDSMENQVKDNIESLFEKTSDYLETRVDLYKLKAVSSSSDLIASLVSKAIMLFVFSIALIIVNIGIALFIGELLGKSYYGFFVVAALYLVTGLIFKAMRRKWFKEPIADGLIKKLLN